MLCIRHKPRYQHHVIQCLKTYSLTQADLLHQLRKAECLCSKPLFFSDLNISTKVYTANLDVQTCYVIEHQQPSADLQVFVCMYIFLSKCSMYPIVFFISGYRKVLTFCSMSEK